MPSLTFRDLLEINFAELAAAVDDWKKVNGSLKKLAEQAESGMLAKSDTARWEGVNAGVSKKFIQETTKEFSDAQLEAHSFYNVLDDAHQELIRIQRALRQIVEIDGPNHNIEFMDAGKGKIEWVIKPDGRGGSGEREDSTAREKEASLLAERIKGLVAEAGEIDSSAARGLHKIHGGDANNFRNEVYDSLDDAQAGRAADLADKGPKMTDAEFREFNLILKNNGRDPDFATAFHAKFGSPEENLRFYATMSLNGTEGDSKIRLELTRELQRNMGIALATATDPDNRPHLIGWGEGMRQMGNEKIDIERPGSRNNTAGDSSKVSSVYGYQALGGLLRYGNYDPSFINPIAEHVIQIHQKDPDRFASVGANVNADEDYGLNPSGKSGAHGFSPLSGVLEGLGHSPEAAQKIFSDTYQPTVYNDDGTPNPKKTLGYGYFDELTGKDFDWPQDSPLHGDTDAGKNALGHALEAATRGIPYDSDSKSPPHSEESAGIANKIVALYGSSPEMLDGSPMRDSLGNITAEYMRDIQAGIMGDHGDVIATHGESADLRTFSENYPEGLKEGALEAYLVAVGKDPDAYGAIINAQQTVTSELVSEALNSPDVYTSVEGEAGVRARVGGEISGLMAEARTQAIVDDQTASDKEFNDGIAGADKWVGRTIDMAAGRFPVVGDAAVWVTEDIREQVMERYTREPGAEALKDREVFLAAQRKHAEQALYDAVHAQALDAGKSAADAGSLAQQASDAFKNGYDSEVK